ncbi:MAG: YbaB/EbfC family nucleoid-associated protein [Lentilactobacillus hilgardii]|jgi:DNA-binding YbaB/EbfC family protein|uniref:Nucleoid-associated protein HMPREF0519_0217 n=2 Tax=Lentilactobacillus hilgardii TaxID=1588 RepID=C0XG56_LENH9|nr:YbaB/EbfC family nucleoid-associated protein [Lentilactobacillus hilgardii]EEI18333.1 DNA-binding protein, YbaB/EbfC family [Lentilactobacillus buchneri ATCC 11577]MCI1923797.1 YbaB/EbfC family nucleoid-associated protein [Lentilactobacillus buchneri]RRG11601.1 MAG: YbaB/EbfC family nucleoid-associated protein [Lactobacillus sp.]EEI25642.1 DNA-binding protein, YbaB/EbfC family [Lentilactobacillus hilgardii DSM 20176 = ATCC 8290]EEI69874.1 DNA-binding protein, YbaB/EbfC family [Lentilactobac
MMNGMNMNKMMKQMQKMQKQLKEEQDNLNKQEFTGSAPDDMVVVTFNGERIMTDIKIKPEAIDPDDPEMLSDLIVAAVNDAMKKIKDTTQSTMGKYAKGIPGM